MPETFSPEDIKIHGEDGFQFSDAWGLTCVQLGTTVSKLLELRPYARLTPSDLVGYHFIQYGMDKDIILETIEGIQDGMWSDWDRATALRESLPRVLGDATMGALTQRIRLGDRRHEERMHLDSQLNHFFDLVEENDHANHDVLSLYPIDGSELTYRGRRSLYIGSVVIGSIIGDLSTHTDILELGVEDGSQNHTIVASTISHGTTTSLRAVNVI